MDDSRMKVGGRRIEVGLARRRSAWEHDVAVDQSSEARFEYSIQNGRASLLL